MCRKRDPYTVEAISHARVAGARLKIRPARQKRFGRHSGGRQLPYQSPHLLAPLPEPDEAPAETVEAVSE